MSIFRWGHFSDLHFQKYSYPTGRLRSSLLDKLRDLCPKEKSFDALLIAGDIFDRGQIEEKDQIDSTTKFIQEMADCCGCKHDRIYACAGNHDLKRSEQRAAALSLVVTNYDDTTGFTADKWASNIIYEETCAPYDKILQAIRGLSDNDPIYGADKPIHKLAELEDVNIIILNTAIFAGRTYPGQESSSNADREEKELCIADDHLRKLCEAVKSILSNGKFSIVLAHHGIECFLGYAPDGRFAKECKHLTDALNDMHVDLYLCGHVHAPLQHRIQGTYDEIPQISCGGLFRDDYNCPCFFIGEYDTQKRQISICAYTYNGTWTLATNLNPPWRQGKYDYHLHRLLHNDQAKYAIDTSAACVDFPSHDSSFSENDQNNISRLVSTVAQLSESIPKIDTRTLHSALQAALTPVLSSFSSLVTSDSDSLDSTTKSMTDTPTDTLAPV